MHLYECDEFFLTIRPKNSTVYQEIALRLAAMTNISTDLLFFLAADTAKTKCQISYFCLLPTLFDAGSYALLKSDFTGDLTKTSVMLCLTGVFDYHSVIQSSGK